MRVPIVNTNITVNGESQKRTSFKGFWAGTNPMIRRFAQDWENLCFFSKASSDPQEAANRTLKFFQERIMSKTEAFKKDFFMFQDARANTLLGICIEHSHPAAALEILKLADRLPISVQKKFYKLKPFGILDVADMAEKREFEYLAEYIRAQREVLAKL